MSTRRPEPSPKKPRRSRKKTVTGLLGVGLDGKDGHTRVTKGDDFVLLGGSAETHERMQEFTIRLTERLARKGKRIRDARPEELRDLAGDIT